MSRRLLQFLAILTVFSPLMGCGGLDPNVTTQHNDPSRTGAYLAETSLTPANVLSRGMQEKYSIGSCDGNRPAPRDRCLSGTIVTQPLYMRKVDFNPVKLPWPFGTSATHANGLFLATQNNMVYALDAKTGNRMWEHDLMQDVDPGKLHAFRRGVNATPVIDAANNLMYVLFSTRDQWPEWANCNGPATVDYWLATLNLQDGSTLQKRGPIIASAIKSDGTRVLFNASFQLDHPALLLDRTSLYLAFGSIAWGEGCAGNVYHGWVLRYSPTGLTPQAAFCTTPDATASEVKNRGGGGVWQGGGGLAADSHGSVYFLTGNGIAFVPGKLNPGNAAIKPKPYVTFGDSFIKLTPSGDKLKPLAFVPEGADQLAENDADLGSGGAMIIPKSNLVIGGGKTGYMYVLDRSSMKAVQQFPASTNQYDPTQRDQLWDSGPHLHGSPTYWQGPDRRFGFLYVWGEKDFLRMYRFDKVAQKFEEKSKPPLLASFPEVRLFHQGPVRALQKPMPGGMLSISANGTKAGTGIVWATLPAYDLNPEFKPFPGRLYAFDAESLEPLWDSGWDNGYGVLGHWVPPTIADGNVFLAAGDILGDPKLIVYELGPETDQGRQSWTPFQPQSIIDFQPGYLGENRAVERCKVCHNQTDKLRELLKPRPFHDSYPNEASVRMFPVVALQQLAPPQGHRKNLLLEGDGLRVYETKENPTVQGKLIWRLKESTADLVEVAAPSAGKESPAPIKVRLSPGSVWSAWDGSTVVSAIEKTVPAPESTHGEWLLFKVVKSSGHGILSDQSYIQCVYTHGGHAPAAPPKGRGEIAKVPYYAQYLFYQ